MHVDHTQTGSLSALAAKNTMAGPARKPAGPPIGRAPATEAAQRPSILPFPNKTTAAPETPMSFPPVKSDAKTFGGPETLSVEGLLEAWGQQDTRYDLNSDGVVDMKDLMTLLSDLAADEKRPDDDDVVSYPLATDVRSADGFDEGMPGPSSEVAATGIDLGSTVAAGTAFGAVAPNAPASAPPTEFVPEFVPEFLPEDRGERASEARDATRADHLARHIADAKAKFLFEQLDRNGFEHRPPNNIHELLDTLDLAPADRESLIDRLEARYPRGLGLDTLA